MHTTKKIIATYYPTTYPQVVADAKQVPVEVATQVQSIGHTSNQQHNHIQLNIITSEKFTMEI